METEIIDRFLATAQAYFLDEAAAKRFVAPPAHPTSGLPIEFIAMRLYLARAYPDVLHACNR